MVNFRRRLLVPARNVGSGSGLRIPGPVSAKICDLFIDCDEIKNEASPDKKIGLPVKSGPT